MKRVFWGTLLILGVALVNTAAGADCESASTQSAMNECAAKDRVQADAKLNEVYKSLKDKISLSGKEKLQKAEKAWISYRDAQCEFSSLGSAGGSIHPMVVAGCLTTLTVQQTKILQEQLNCAEGDASCGGQ